MSITAAAPRNAKVSECLDFDAVVIGAGVTGLYQLYKLRELGLRVRVFEAASGVGGTWYWNRYPGARFDSESWTYGYSFSKELLDEWDWSEHFAPQPETERYLNHVADKFDLRRDIQFNSRVASAHYHEDTRSWDITLEDGTRCHDAVFDHRDRHPVGGDHAEHSRRRHLRRPFLPHPSTGPRKASISPASGSASSAPARPRCRRSRKSPRPSAT